jgi:hypothetical protein
MMLKHTLTAAALTALLATPAFAQANKPNPMAKPNSATESSMPNLSNASPESFVQTQHATDWRGTKLIGSSVYGPDNASIGSVNDLLIGNDGNVRAVVIGVGGFLGVGEKNVAIPLDALNISRKPDSSSIEKISVTYTKDELKTAPKFAYYEGTAPQTTGSGITDKIKSLNPMSDSSKK